MKKIWAFVLSAVLLSLPGCVKSTDSSAATEELEDSVLVDVSATCEPVLLL